MIYLCSHLVICLPQNTRTSLIRLALCLIILFSSEVIYGNLLPLTCILVMGACLFNRSKKKAFHKVHISLASRAIFLIS